MGCSKANRDNKIWHISDCRVARVPTFLSRRSSFAGRIAFLRPCILNSLFYAARNELKKIGGFRSPFLNGVVTFEDALLSLATLEMPRRNHRTVQRARRLVIPHFFSDVRPEERALLFGRHTDRNNAVHCFVCRPCSHPLHRAGPDPPKIRLHNSSATIISQC